MNNNERRNGKQPAAYTNGDRPGSGIYAHIVGWGMAVPETILTNQDLEAIMETDDEWIRSRTGIHERRIAAEHETTATLGLEAAQQALEIADILPVELEMVVVATSTPENFFPSTASLIQDWLGASRAGAFDLSAACSGFVYALNMAAQAIRSGSIETALVVGSETMSRVMDWNDRSTCILFGDGAGAVVLTASDVPGGVLSSVLRSDGSGCDLLGVPTVGSRDARVPDLGISLSIDGFDDGHKMHKMHMHGREVFKFATRVIGDSILEALSKAGLTLEDVDMVVPHQANDRILQSAARSLGVEKDLFYSNVARYGNTSAASIPIALCEALEEGLIEEDDTLVFVGFGGGLTWASMVLQWGVPESLEEQFSHRFSKQRRRLSYTAARWRAKARRSSRRFNETIERIQPKRGRLSRLRHKMDQHDWD